MRECLGRRIRNIWEGYIGQLISPGGSCELPDGRQVPIGMEFVTVNVPVGTRGIRPLAGSGLHLYKLGTVAEVSVRIFDQTRPRQRADL